MPVQVNGKKIIPAPQFEIAKEVQRSEDGTTRNIVYNISVRGTLSAIKGSPNSSGVLWDQPGYPPDEDIPSDSRLASLRNKQGSLCKLFCDEAPLVEIQPWDGTQSTRFRPRVKSINFAEGHWFDKVDYTIAMEADKIWFGAIECCSDINDSTKFLPDESWTFEQADEHGRTYRLTHTLASQRKKSFNEDGSLDKEGWENAKSIVVPHMGINMGLVGQSKANNFAGWEGYNYTIHEQIDEGGGKYSITETWLLYDPETTNGIPCLEEYVVNTRISTEGRTQVTIDGTLTGLEKRDNTTHALISTRYENAESRFADLEPALFGICQDISGVALNPNLLGSAIGRNILNGVITFNREFDDRPEIYTGAISTTVQTSERYGTDVFAAIAVLGRKKGPVLQDIHASTVKGRSLSIEIVMPVATYANSLGSAKPDVSAIINNYKPTGTTKIFKDKDDDNWSAESGRYSRQVGWTYEI
jgi:hypothetical protein